MASISESKEVSECLDSLFNRLRITRESCEIDSDFGKSYTGTILKLCVNGRNENEEQAELCLLLKMALRDTSSRNLLTIESSYQCEAFVYETVFHLFSEMQVKAKIKDRFESYPKYYASSTKAFEESIVLENLTSFKVVDRLETLTYRRARILAKEIGKLHGLSFVLRRKKPKLFQKLSRKIRNEKLEDGFVKMTLHAVNIWTPKYLALFDSETSRMMYETVRTLPCKTHEMFARHYYYDPEDEYGVISHCDLWSTNLLFNEQEVRIIDWQTSRVCSPAVDLSLILFSCCDGEVRNNHKQDLIQAYYDSCSEMLLEFGEDPNVVFPRAILQKHLETYSGYALCFALRSVLLISIPEDEIPDWSLFETYTEVIEKHLTISLNSNIFDKRIRDILTDYIGYGYDM